MSRLATRAQEWNEAVYQGLPTDSIEQLLHDAKREDFRRGFCCNYFKRGVGNIGCGANRGGSESCSIYASKPKDANCLWCEAQMDEDISARVRVIAMDEESRGSFGRGNKR